MFKVVRRWWKYLIAKLNRNFDENADPKIQLEQAIAEAREQHQRLTDQATNVIASQKQAEIRLNSKMTELEKLNANARQALVMADEAQRSGDAAKAEQYTHAAETIANQLIQVERDIESLSSLVIEATRAADQAKAAVAQNSRLLQDKIAQRSALLSQLEQAKMQEQMNAAMSQLTASVGDDVPTMAEIEEKIQVRYAKAKAASELSGATVESRILEVEQATANLAAHDRLAQLRAEMGLGSGSGPAITAGGDAADQPGESTQS